MMHTAMMHTIMMHTVSRPVASAKLPIVDFKTDDRLFAVLDEGCNSTCHTKDFIKKAIPILHQYGREVGELTGDVKRYKGVGAATTVGSRIIPWGVALFNGSYIVGEIKSNELDKSGDLYMLLSLRAQGTLGIVKDVQTGTCYLKEYKDYCQLYEVAGSGL